MKIKRVFSIIILFFFLANFNSTYGKNPLVKEICKVTLMGEFNQIPHMEEISSQYTPNDIKLMDKIQNIYCKRSIQKCEMSWGNYKNTGKLNNNLSNPNFFLQKEEIKNYKCQKRQFIADSEEGIACYTELSQGFEIDFGVKTYFTYIIPELKNSNFEGCKSAITLCKNRLKQITGNKPLDPNNYRTIRCGGASPQIIINF